MKRLKQISRRVATVSGNENRLSAKTFRGGNAFTASCRKHKEGPKCREKVTHEALEIIHTVAGCAYNNLISMTDLSYQPQTFKI